MPSIPETICADTETEEHVPLAEVLELGRLSDRGGLGPVFWLKMPVTDQRPLWAVRVVLVAGRPLLVYPDQRTYFETVLG
jgi:hypothetical protein